MYFILYIIFLKNKINTVKKLLSTEEKTYKIICVPAKTLINIKYLIILQLHVIYFSLQQYLQLFWTKPKQFPFIKSIIHFNSLTTDPFPFYKPLKYIWYGETWHSTWKTTSLWYKKHLKFRELSYLGNGSQFVSINVFNSDHKTTK